MLIKALRLTNAEQTTDAEAMESFVRMRHHQQFSKGQVAEYIINFIKDPLFLDGECYPKVQEMVHEMGLEMCPLNDPAAVCEAMDMTGNGATLNKKGLEILRGVKHFLGFGRSKNPHHRGWLASRGDILDVEQAVHDIMQREVPFKTIMDPAKPHGVDGVLFDPLWPFFEEFLKSFGLLEIAKVRSVQVGATIDAADISRLVSQMSMGLKPIDPASLCPKTKLPLGALTATKFQSASNQRPFAIYFVKDGKTVYTTTFKLPFEFLAKMATDPPAPFKPFTIVVPQDGSSIWKSLGRGGGMKVYDEPCAHCAITDKQLTEPRLKPCPKCSAKKVPCYHWEVTDDDHLQKTQQAIDEMKSPENQFSTLFNYDPDKVDDLILHLNPGEARKYKQKNNIEFQPS